MEKLPQVKPDAGIFCGATQHGPKDDRQTGWACIRVEGGKLVHKKFGSTPGQSMEEARWEAMKEATRASSEPDRRKSHDRLLQEPLLLQHN